MALNEVKESEKLQIIQFEIVRELVKVSGL